MADEPKDVEQRSLGYLNQVEASGSIFSPLYPPARLIVAATESGEGDDPTPQESFNGAIV